VVLLRVVGFGVPILEVWVVVTMCLAMDDDVAYS